MQNAYLIGIGATIRIGREIWWFLLMIFLHNSKGEVWNYNWVPYAAYRCVCMEPYVQLRCDHKFV